MPDDRSLVSCPRDAFPDGTDVLVHAPPPARRNLFVRLAKLGKASSRRCENGEQCRRGHPRPKPKKLNRSVLLDAHAEPTEAPSPRIRRRLGHGGRVRLDNKSPGRHRIWRRSEFFEWNDAFRQHCSRYASMLEWSNVRTVPPLVFDLDQGSCTDSRHFLHVRVIQRGFSAIGTCGSAARALSASLG